MGADHIATATALVDAWWNEVEVGCEMPPVDRAELIDAIAAAIEGEREACAGLFEGMRWLCLDHGGEEAEKIAATIRARAGGTDGA